MRYNISHICQHFGYNTSTIFKQWIDENYKVVRLYSKIFALKLYKSNCVTPPHLYGTKRINFHLCNDNSVKKLERLVDCFNMKIIGLEISDSYRSIQKYKHSLSLLSRSLSNLLPSHVWNQIFRYHSVSFNNCYNRLTKKSETRIRWIKNKRDKQRFSELIPIQYFYSTENRDDTTKHVFSLKEFPHTTSQIPITVTPDLFLNKTFSPLDSVNNKWFVNISGHSIPKETECLLQLGDRFSLPFGNKEHMIHEFIKDVESNIKKLDNNTKLMIRNKAVQQLQNFKNKKPTFLPVDSSLISLYRSTVNFTKENNNIIFTRADKGNTTVAMNRDKYISYINEMLSDKDTYITVKKNPIKKIESDINNMLKKFLDKKYISIQSYHHLRSSDGLLPKAYGVPKIHKTGYPLRIIVSSINSPLYAIGNFLHKILNDSLPQACGYVKNSFQLFDCLSNLKIDESDILISLDVVSLFTNVPVDLALSGVNDRWPYIQKMTDIPKNDFINIIKFILTSTYFTFDNNIYKQTFGTPMGSPLSPIIADIVLQDIENKALAKIGLDLPLYYRYVDDIFLAAPRSSIDKILQIYNSYHNRIQFTCELEENQCISFLDLKIYRCGVHLVIDWFQKPTYSGRYLSYFSNHPSCHKIGTIYNLIDRAILLSQPEFHEKNIIFCINILMNNGYPLPYIFKYIHIRIKKLITVNLNRNHNISHMVNNDTDNNNHKKFIALPYIKGLSESISVSFKNIDVATGFKCFNRLNRFIRVHKDVNPTYCNKNVIYKIGCTDCDASYVGQTKRQLKTRINEHKLNKKQSVVSQHVTEINHHMDWDNVKILDQESNYHKRLISEAIFIKKQRNGLNIMDEIELLDHAYFPLIDVPKS